jgi:hypothetical protein
VVKVSNVCVSRPSACPSEQRAVMLRGKALSGIQGKQNIKYVPFHKHIKAGTKRLICCRDKTNAEVFDTLCKTKEKADTLLKIKPTTQYQSICDT